MRALLGLGLLALLGSGCAHFECTAHGGAEVRSLSSEHFVVTSALPLAAHRAEAERLELLWDTFAAFFGADVAHARVPMVLLDDTGDVESFASGYSGFVRRNGPRVLVVGAPAAEGAPGTNAHELTHLVSAFMLPRQPRWLAEGLATLFEDATFKDAHTVKMGRWNPGRAEEAFVVGVLPLEELMEWGGLKFDQSELLFYASAWAWVHYLVNHEEARLQRLFAGLRGRKPVADVMVEVFPPAERKTLQAAVQAYLGQARFRGWETRLNRVPQLSAPVLLSPSEVHAVRSQLFLRDEKAAQQELEKAVALAPKPLDGPAAVLRAELAKEDAKALVTQFPTTPEVLVAAWLEDDAAADRAVLTAALAAHPDDVQLLLIGARVALRQKDLELAATWCARGLSLAPWSIEFVVVQLDLELARRECEEAQRTLSQVISLGPERPSERDRKFFAELQEATSKCETR